MTSIALLAWALDAHGRYPSTAPCPASGLIRAGSGSHLPHGEYVLVGRVLPLSLDADAERDHWTPLGGTTRPGALRSDQVGRR